MAPLGYMGKILDVDLTSGAVRTRDLTQRLADDFIGGTGIGARLLCEEGAYRADPLGPDNVLIFGTGPYTATNIPLSNRFGVCARSPLTYAFGEAECGGHWANDLKRAGFDLLLLRGRAERPVYLWIHDGQVEVRSAEHLWGRDTFDTHDTLRAEVGDEKAGVACIGPAGERLARIAAIMVDGRDGRAVGRTGLGAVMGSKRLKAIVVRGHGEFALADPDGLTRSVRSYQRDIVQQAKGFGRLGTAGGIPTHDKMGNWPIRNWRQGQWPEATEKISGARMAETILTARYYCGNCIIGCGRTVHVAEGPYAGIEQAGPEYETISLNGANLLVDNLEAVQKANELCNRYGLDTISSGAVIGFAMEAYERGLLPKERTDGLEIVWGDPDVLVELTRRIGEREGIGWELGEGVLRLARKLGPAAEEFAVHVKGLEFPAHDPRAFYANGPAYATSARGACHLSSFAHAFQRVVTLPEFGYAEPVFRHDAARTPALVALGQNLMGLFDALKICKFILFGGIKPVHLLEWYNLATGRDLTLERFVEIGERIFTQKRLFNLAAGFTAADDRLPPRIVREPREVGGQPMPLPPYEQMIAALYRLRGWDERGVPTPALLERLGLEPLAAAV